MHLAVRWERVIDKTFIQSKMLNQSKGPAVHSLRAQADKANYSRTMRMVLQNQEKLRYPSDGSDRYFDRGWKDNRSSNIFRCYLSLSCGCIMYRNIFEKRDVFMEK